ncbi:DUF1521 domain-containing protein [Acidisphaera sp. S103]|uniref:DUF1521 domain-containing protein n=1 Tax=Acidisphaera sp. S103 TaxID=1747223 RepID=UPI00131CF14D|nr:DUF1521 domain-containing protein [Acidisphaera sp. S103]
MSDTLQLQGSAGLGFTGAESPFLTSYQGLSGSEMIGLADAQSMYSPTPPQANQQQAMQYVEAAAQATDPQLQQQLLEQAISMLQGGGSNPAPQPISTPIASPILSTPISTTAATSTDPSLMVSSNSVNTGEYTITGSTNDDGSLTITNNQTGQSRAEQSRAEQSRAAQSSAAQRSAAQRSEVWGDPHLKVNGQTIADFQKDDLNIQLQDGTVIHIDPTATNSDGVSHIAQVSITNGDQSVTMGGTGTNGFQQGVTTSGVNDDASFQSALYNTPSATDITLGADGNLYYNNANGSMSAEITAQPDGGQTDLDGAGGGLVGGTGSTGTTASAFTAADSTGGMQQTMNQLLGLLGQNQDSFYSIMMMQTLSSMMSQSGYAQA